MMDEYIRQEALSDHVMACGRPISCCVVTEYRGVRFEIGNWVCDGKVYFVVKAGGNVGECMEMSAKDDVVEVVRCKNCANSRPLNRKDPFENIYCDECVWCCLRCDAVFEDHFCGDGKRKDGVE